MSFFVRVASPRGRYHQIQLGICQASPQLPAYDMNRAILDPLGSGKLKQTILQRYQPLSSISSLNKVCTKCAGGGEEKGNWLFGPHGKRG